MKPFVTIILVREQINVITLNNMNEKLLTWIIGFLGGCIGGTLIYLVIKFV